MHPATYDKRMVESSDAKNCTTFYDASKKAFKRRFGAEVNVLTVVSQARSLGKRSPYSYIEPVKT